jgi:hypothetical protein
MKFIGGRHQPRLTNEELIVLEQQQNSAAENIEDSTNYTSDVVERNLL